MRIAQNTGGAFAFGQQVDFVVHDQLRHFMCTDFFEHGIYIVHLPLEIGVAGIDHMQQHIGQCGFFQCGGKRRYQLVRQIAYETDRVG